MPKPPLVEKTPAHNRGWVIGQRAYHETIIGNPTSFEPRHAIEQVKEFGIKIWNDKKHKWDRYKYIDRKCVGLFLNNYGHLTYQLAIDGEIANFCYTVTIGVFNNKVQTLKKIIEN